MSAFNAREATSREPNNLTSEMMYTYIVNTIDWNRVIIQAKGLHIRNHAQVQEDICGECIKSVLLRMDE